MTRLAARQLQLRYGPDAPPILSEFSLDIRAGEFVGVIGPNGSGKSTLVRALSRALRPDAGAVLLGEDDLYRVSARASARQIAVVPQDTSVTLDFTVQEVVRMGRAPHLPRSPFATETTADARIAAEALHTAGVADLALRAVTTLSGGERQRVLLARALAQQPQILLLDEPTAHLDLRHQTEMLTLARELAHEQGLAVLAVLHDLNLAAAHCDQLVLLSGGHLAAQGRPAEVLTAETLQKVYGARVWIRPHPVSGRPLVLTLPELPRAPAEPKIGFRIHVICGGGTGAGLLVALHHAGYAVTVGGLNEDDPDADAARLLDIPWAKEAPFSPLSEAVLSEARRFSGAADAAILAEVSFGPDNLANLAAALALRLAGIPVACLQNPARDFPGRDFTGGEASRLWEQLYAAGAALLPGPDAALEWAANLSK